MNKETYEVLFIIPAKYAEDELGPIKQIVIDSIKKFDGEITKEDTLGKRKLAYPIKQIYHGYYFYYHFDINPENVEELNKSLRHSQEILRHIVVKPTPMDEKTQERLRESAKEQAESENEEENEKPAPKKVAAKKEETPVVEKAPKEEPKEEIKEDETSEPVVEEEKKEEIVEKETEVKEEAKKKEKTDEKKEKKMTLEELDKSLDEILKDDII